MKFTFFSFLLVLSTSSQALAARAIVMMKDASAFQRTLSTRGTWSQSLPGKIEKSLPQLNTFVVDTNNPAEMERLKSSAGVAYVEKEYFHPALPVVSSGVQLANIDMVKPGAPWGIKAVKAPEAWAHSNKGQGIRVLVLDSGMNASHPSLAPNFEKGRNFTDDGDSTDFSDRTGHGTHVGGTIAAVEDGEGFSGVAPKASLLAGKVCQDGGCSNVAIVAAISWGIDQGVDVMNLSLGSFGNGSPAERAALLRADQAGISVVAATGNYGSNEVLFPASVSTVIGVGAVDRNLNHAVFSQYGPEVALVAPGVQIVSTIPVGSGRSSTVTIAKASGPQTLQAYHLKGTAVPYDELTKAVVDCGLGEPADFAGKDVKDKHVLITRSEAPIADQIRNAMRAGATSVIVVNNGPGVIDTRLFEKENVLFAVGFFVEQALGEQIRTAINTSPNTLVSLKSELTSYKETFGTSMASPHVAGVVALVKAANKKLKPSQVKALLMKTATPILPNDDNRYGSGLVNAEAAVDAALEIK